MVCISFSFILHNTVPFSYLRLLLVSKSTGLDVGLLSYRYMDTLNVFNFIVSLTKQLFHHKIFMMTNENLHYNVLISPFTNVHT